MVVVYPFRLSPELKAALEEKAQAEGIELNRYLSRVLAYAIDRPELAKVPQLKRGPKPKTAAAAK